MKRKTRTGFAPKTGNKQTDALFLRTKFKYYPLQRETVLALMTGLVKNSWKQNDIAIILTPI